MLKYLKRKAEKAFCWVVISLMFMSPLLIMLGHYFLIGY